MRTSKQGPKFFAATIISIIICTSVKAQTENANGVQESADTSLLKLNMDGLHQRPLHPIGKSPFNIGGYIEANTQYSGANGESDGFSFQFRRMSLILSSSSEKKIKFLSEIEFTGEEINIEYAAMDIAFHPLINFRGGIILNPIGSFNQTHDGPNWDFIDRPISSTTILAATLSNAGFGLYGEHSSGHWAFGYEAYLTNGFDEGIILNEDNHTSLEAGKLNIEKFEKSSSGLPMFTGKLSFGNRRIGELGISYMSGVFNEWKQDEIVVDKKRSVNVIAVDFKTSLIKDRLNIIMEGEKVFVDVPESYPEQFGSKQFGVFADIVGTILKHKMLGWEKANMNLGVRLDYADYNQDTFAETGEKIADDVWAIVPGIAFRPVSSTVLRLNYRYQKQRSLLGYPPVYSAAIQFGFSTYF